MSISKKLYYGFAGVLALVLLLLVVNLLALGREHATKARTERTRVVEQATAAVRFQMMQNRLYLGNYLLSGDRREMDQMTNGVMKLNDLLSKATAAVSIEQERSALARVAEAERSWVVRFANPLIEKRKQVDGGKATVAELQIFYLEQNPAEWLKNSTDPLDEAVAASTDALRRQIQSDESAGLVTRMVTILGTILAVLMGIAIAYYTSKSITEPLTQLIGIAREIGEAGDLNHTIQIDRNDEIGALARSFSNLVAYLKEMAAISDAIAGGDLTVEFSPRSQHDLLSNAFVKMTYGLRALVRNVRDSAAQVAGGSGQVASASEESAKINVQAASSIDEVTSTMHEMSINVQNVVKNTQTQASSVSETSASIDEMVASIQRVADTAKILLEISQRSREEVQNGISTMEKASEGLTKINTSIHSSATIISDLGGRADDIGKIVEVIDDLAEQTNLLALNAAIEAARAGEHGLGFAVVADEVRKLAEKSAQSTREISELIQSIQKEARRAVENMEKSTNIVNEGLHLGSDLSSALHKISTVVTEVYNFAQEIGAATNEQSHGSSQIAKATTRLNEITHEISSSVEEQASGAQAVVKAMEKMRELTQRSTSGSTELAASAEQMSKMSRVLLESMDRFVLESTNGMGRDGHTDVAKSRLAAAAGVANQAKGA